MIRIKEVLVFTFVVFLLCSCVEKKNEKNQKDIDELYKKYTNSHNSVYVNELDTFYEANSTKINVIKNTFFKFNGTQMGEEIELEISKYLGGNVFNIFIQNKLDFGSATLSKIDFDEWIDNLDTLRFNPTKRLHYSIGDNGGFMMNSGNDIHIVLPELTENSTVSAIWKSDVVDSLQLFYRRYTAISNAP